MRLPCFFAFAALLVGARAEPILHLAGSSTVSALLEPIRPDLERAAQTKIEIANTGSIAGLLALSSGAADAAMLAMPVEDAARAANQKQPGRVDVNALHIEVVGEMNTVFVVNPRNPVRALSSVQLSALLSGETTNWREVGGTDSPVIVVTLGSGGSFLDHLLQGRAMTSQARVVARASQIAAIVSENVNAIGIVGASHPRGQTTVIQTDAHLSAPLLLVTQGAPKPSMMALVEAVRSALARAK